MPRQRQRRHQHRLQQKRKLRWRAASAMAVMAAMEAMATRSQEGRMGLPRRTTLATSQLLPRRVAMMALLAILPPRASSQSLAPPTSGPW